MMPQPPSQPRPLQRLLVSRAQLLVTETDCRTVHLSCFASKSDGLILSDYVADRAPLFYRKLEHVIKDLEAGLFLTAFRDTLCKIPSAESFQESHFGEIIAGLFAEEISGLTRLYSKLSLLTAENSNAYKMDLVLCNAALSPVEFIFGEVKSSSKSVSDGCPPGHDKSCYASLFDSFNKYEAGDLQFDLAAARDNIGHIPSDEGQRIKDALLPYGDRAVKYAGFVIIDSGTHREDEARVLATRKNKKDFGVELICIESLKTNIDAAYLRMRTSATTSYGTGNPGWRGEM